jgi:predicted RNase H-like HicB family nuclease
MHYALTAYIEAALELARYDKLEDGAFAGEIPRLPGVVAFAPSLRQCEHELRSTLEDWILVGLRLGHRLLLRQVQSILDRPITLDEWDAL